MRKAMSYKTSKNTKAWKLKEVLISLLIIKAYKVFYNNLNYKGDDEYEKEWINTKTTMFL